MCAKVMKLSGCNANKKLSAMGELLLDDEIIVFHILSYLPLRSLFRFKCVCKRWSTLFLHPTFLYLHYKNSPFSHLLSEDANILRQLDFDYPDRWMGFTDICRSSYNLILQHNKSKSPPQYRIQCEQLCDMLPVPNPLYPSLCITLEFVSNPSSCGAVKLLSVHDDGENNLGYELFSLGNPSCPRWRPIPSSKYRSRRKMTSIQFFFRMGVAYCICFLETNDDYDDLDIQVDVLDMVNETYIGRTAFPRARFDFSNLSTTTTHLLDWNGRLSFYQLLKDELHVLVLDDPTNLKWAESKRIIKLQFLKPSNYHYKEEEKKEQLMTFHACADKSTLLFMWQVDKDNQSLCYYDIYTGDLSTSKLHPTTFSTMTDAELVALEVARFALHNAGL